jgi:hypothetical protein
VNFYRNGNIAIEVTGDGGGGYNVGWINPGEWLEWKEVPIQGVSVHLRVRVASPNDNSSLRFVVDGVDYPSLPIPNTGNWQIYTNIESGTTYTFPKNSTHTVRLVCETGGFNINYWDYHNDIPVGQIVILRSSANNLLVSAPNSTSPLIANQTVIGLTEEFQLVDQAGSYWYGCVALKSLANNRFVTANPTGAAPLLANATTAGLAQTFQWTDNGDGTITLRALVNNMNVSAGNAGAQPLVNNRINAGSWETFALVPVPVKITATISSSALTLSWPVNYLGWILQTNSVGLGPIVVWGDVASSKSTNQWTVQMANPVRPVEFFRLRRP